MNRLILVFLTAVLAACGSKAKKTMEVGPTTALPNFHIRHYEKQTLANGLTVIWIPDESLPYISLQMMIKAGTSQDVSGKEGLSGFTARLLDKGTKKRKGPKIAEDLEQIGSGFEVEAQPDYILANVSALSFHRDNILDQFQEILLSPAFPKDEVERQKKLALAGLMKVADSPEGFLNYLFPPFLYGEGNAYSNRPSGNPRSVRTFTKADVQGFYDRFFNPAISVLAVVGKYDEAWKQKVVKSFEGWKRQPDHRKPAPDFPMLKSTELLLVDRPDLNQAQIRFGFKGISRSNPEYLELKAAEKILGDPSHGFGSRLFEEVREKRGLTYGIYSWFEPRAGTGPFEIQTFTRVEKTGEIIRETLKVYNKFVKDGVTDEEVSTVKAVLRAQFPRILETPEALARQLLYLNVFGVQDEYLANFYSNVDKLDKKDINAAIQKYFDPSNMRILVYAPKKATEDSLSGLGRLTVKEYKEFLR